MAGNFVVETELFSVHSQVTKGYEYCEFDNRFIHGAHAIRGAAEFLMKGNRENFHIPYSTSPVDISNSLGEVIHQVRDSRLISRTSEILPNASIWSAFLCSGDVDMPFCISENDEVDGVYAGSLQEAYEVYRDYLIKESYRHKAHLLVNKTGSFISCRSLSDVLIKIKLKTATLLKYKY